MIENFKSLLVSADLLGKFHAEVIRRAPQEHELDEASLLEASQIGEAYRNVMLFQYYPELVLDLCGTRVGAFFNSYFWFIRFRGLHESRYGADPGLGQYLIDLLQSAPEDVDWLVLEPLDELARGDYYPK